MKSFREFLGEAAMPVEEFKSLKKGDKLKVTYDSVSKKGAEIVLQVKSRSTSKKYDTDKVTMINPENPNGVKYILYSRKGGDATMGIGNLAVVLKSWERV